jgi:integrase
MSYSINQQKFLSDKELESFVETLRKFSLKEPRNTALLFFMLHTGARAQEALNIRRSDLNEQTSSVLIRGLKSSNDREIPLPKWLFKRLWALHTGPELRMLFGISYPRLDQVWRDYRPVPKKLHCLRHTFALKVFRRTKDLRLVQVALGHRNIQNTMVYASYEYTTNELKRILE